MNAEDAGMEGWCIVSSSEHEATAKISDGGEPCKTISKPKLLFTKLTCSAIIGILDVFSWLWLQRTGLLPC